MGFDFSAVTALLGGYDKTERRNFDAGAEQRRRQRGRRDNAEPAGNATSNGGPAHADGPPVTGGTGVAFNGIGRALDALISVEETRRRKGHVAEADGKEAGSLSLTLKASLPPPAHARPSPSDAGTKEREPEHRVSEPARDWDEIRDLIEALATAERPVQESGRSAEANGDSGDIRPFRPTTIIDKG